MASLRAGSKAFSSVISIMVIHQHSRIPANPPFTMQPKGSFQNAHAITLLFTPSFSQLPIPILSWPGAMCVLFFFFFFFAIFYFLLFRAAFTAYRGSQSRGQIGATSASLHHSYSNTGSEPHLRPTHSSRQFWILNPLSEARD